MSMTLWERIHCAKLAIRIIYAKAAAEKRGLDFREAAEVRHYNDVVESCRIRLAVTGLEGGRNAVKISYSVQGVRSNHSHR